MPPDRERMANLKPVFKEDGVITAGNSSQISDGAAALLIASESAVRVNLEADGGDRRRVVVGSDPVLMLDGPILATTLVLERAGLGLRISTCLRSTKPSLRSPGLAARTPRRPGTA